MIGIQIIGSYININILFTNKNALSISIIEESLKLKLTLIKVIYSRSHVKFVSSKVNMHAIITKNILLNVCFKTKKNMRDLRTTIIYSYN